MTFASRVLAFYKELHIEARLPRDIEVLNPYQDEKAFALCRQFYNTYYNDKVTRRIIIGINPGRNGGGLTGIPFTDPIKLETICGIKNDLVKKPELSADFIYAMIQVYGGARSFYSKFYINSVCPLGFTRSNKNLNYYDSQDLIKTLMPFITSSLKKQIQFGVDSDKAYCLGEGDNYRFLMKLNAKEKLFKEIIPLPHPRFIMQYRRKQINEFIGHYIERLS